MNGRAAYLVSSVMRLQFSLLRGNLVISNGVEAWTLTDALAAFLRSTWLKSDEAIRMFGEAQPDLPPEALWASRSGDMACGGPGRGSGGHPWAA